MLVKKFKYLKRVREPNLCEPGSRDFLVKFYLWFKFSQSSHFSREPVNRCSHITQAPNSGPFSGNFPFNFLNICQVSWRKFTNFFKQAHEKSRQHMDKIFS